MDHPHPQLRRRVVEALVTACIVLCGWIIVLGLTLPRRYDAAHWNLAWVGFDVALLCGLAATAWAAWRRRAVIVLFATVTATLLLADAWFDVTTARSRDLQVSVLQAVFVEIPFALFLMWVVVRVINNTRGSVWTDRTGGRPRTLWTVEFTHPSERHRHGASDGQRPRSGDAHVPSELGLPRDTADRPTTKRGPAEREAVERVDGALD